MIGFKVWGDKPPIPLPVEINVCLTVRLLLKDSSIFQPKRNSRYMINDYD